MSPHDPLYHHHRCAGKDAYLDKRAAKAAAKRDTSKSGRVIHPYHCPICGQWHVTKLSKDARRFARIAALKERLLFPPA